MPNDLTGTLEEYTEQYTAAEGGISQEYEPHKFIHLNYKSLAFGDSKLKKVEITLWEDSIKVWSGDLYALLSKIGR